MNEGAVRPLIAHLVYRLDAGGMERVLVSVIAGSRDHFRHVVICLAGFGRLRTELEALGVECLAIGKRPGKDPAAYLRLWRLLRRLHPDLLQTYNIGTFDAVLVAHLAGVCRVVHAEHGRDASDPRGSKRKYRLLRRALQPLVKRFVAVSADLETWLRREVGISARKLVLIRNGIDVAAFAPTTAPAAARIPDCPLPAGALIVVAVGRLDAVKDQATLVRAFARVAGRQVPGAVQLVIAGKGPEQAALQALIETLHLAGQVHLLGDRSDLPHWLGRCDIFALSSVAEGIPLTVLEAMAAGLPVVATRVGGVAEVVVEQATGLLVPAQDPAAFAEALECFIADAARRRRCGAAGQVRARAEFSRARMVEAYVALYTSLLAACQPRTKRSTSGQRQAGGGR